ncbi:alpha/beta hydrolase family protein [Tundrisphaera lichenicola]|uniref:alpha/beta hydrolase family protein n=1 Tax=Tundrisphaera lichenicola TaxID=2029860 RepID=UPI003EB734F4
MKNALGLGWIGMLLVAASPGAQTTPPQAPTPTAEVKAHFLALLDRPKVPLDPKTIEVKRGNRGVISERLDFASERRKDGSMERVPTLLVRPDWAKPGDRLPVVMVLHGTGGRKEGVWPWLEELAHAGFVAVAIDGRYHGERAGGMLGSKVYNQAITRAWRSGPDEPQDHPFYYDTCWDVWRTVDYLQTRPDVDPDRIGLIGISKGGIETWLSAAVDDRIKVAVPAISVQCFRWSLEHERWQGRANTVREAHEAAAADLGEPEINHKVCRTLWDKILPGILDQLDCPSMLRLFAGRPLLIIGGEKDPNCPIEGAEIAINAARAAYQEAGAEDKLKVMIAPGVAHSITPQQHAAAIDWFIAWLKPTPPPEGAARFLHYRALASHRKWREHRKAQRRERELARLAPPQPFQLPDFSRLFEPAPTP